MLYARGSVVLCFALPLLFLALGTSLPVVIASPRTGRYLFHYEPSTPGLTGCEGCPGWCVDACLGAGRSPLRLQLGSPFGRGAAAPPAVPGVAGLTPPPLGISPRPLGSGERVDPPGRCRLGAHWLTCQASQGRGGNDPTHHRCPVVH